MHDQDSDGNLNTEDTREPAVDAEVNPPPAPEQPDASPPVDAAEIAPPLAQAVVEERPRGRASRASDSLDDGELEDAIEEVEEPRKHRGRLARARDVMSSRIPLLPVASRPFFPGQAVPLLMDAAHWGRTIETVAESDHKILGIVLVDSETSESAKIENFREIGTAARVHRAAESDGKLQVLVECLHRFRITQFTRRRAPFAAQVEYLPEPAPIPEDEIKAYAMAVINTIKELLPLNPLYVEELRMFLDRFGPDDPSHLADFAASLTTSTKIQLQEVLEAVPLMKRMEKVLVLLNKELELAHAQQTIRQSVEERMQKTQRDFFLREQLKAIQKELGIAKDDRTAEVDRFKERLKKLTLSEEAQKRVDEEMDKLSILETGSPEYSVTRNYLDWITVLPWGKHSKDKLNLKRARRVLDRDHYGLEDVKDRILEFLAVGMMKGEIAGSIILLVGPPGVGKTSIGHSIADALGRKFYRFSVGGIRDEAEIKGHRRTYIGAMPGKFLQAMKEAGTANPVIMLDEIDKIGASYHGDPASALLEVLDPEQNNDFLDHYLDLRFDLSKVLFVCTANQTDSIPGPLLDRMEVIQLSGYIASEKLAIAKKYLLPRQIDKAGLEKDAIKIAPKTLAALIEGYARDAGVRRLEKQLGKIVRKCTVKLLEDTPKPITVTEEDLKGYLGSPVFRDERKLSGPGVVTGLAWTAMGGATLSVEAQCTHSYTRGFKLTGQLGDVMKESADIAYSFVVGHAKEFGADPDFFEKAFIHLHVPAGATPKDGPSAGVTMATALVSLARQQPVKRIAMTGEITLTGEVFPVGGIREKLIAARRAGIKEILLPEDNRGEFDEVPEHVRKGLTIHFINRFAEVPMLVFRGQR
jgi:ATP-dependent Lon protease